VCAWRPGVPARGVRAGMLASLAPALQIPVSTAVAPPN
jgi:hypothetical protein